MNRHSAICVITLLTIAQITLSQPNTASITGLITDASNGEPLFGASVYIEQLARGTVANDNGRYNLNSLAPGTYKIVYSYMGYHQQTETVSLKAGEKRKVNVHLKAEAQSLSEVTITAKSEARQLREQAMPISVISLSQLQGTVNGISDIINKTVGVTLRTSGGVGSSSRLSVRGLEGKRVGFFLDEMPLNDHSDFLDINDVPIEMIDRIEIYKGVVPAKFGGSAMGGAVNIVIREYPERYVDISYTAESFNTHKLQTVLKRNIPDKGFIFGLGGGYTSSDNDYIMELPNKKGLKVRRDHDRFRKMMIGGSFKAKKWWFDEIEIEPVFINTYRQIQGIETNIRQAHTKSQLILLGTTLKKDDFFIEGIDFDMSAAITYSIFNLVDTAKHWYDWHGNSYPTISPMGGEMGATRFASLSNDKQLLFINKLNLGYVLNTQHSLNFNSFITITNAHPHDDYKNRSYGRQMVFDSRIRSWVSGLTYDYRTKNDKFLNSMTVRSYIYTTHTHKAEIYGLKVTEINLNKSDLGISNAMRYRIQPFLMGKLSVGHDIRMPSELELLGDGSLIEPATMLLPERNSNINIGALYDLTGKQRSNLQIEINGFYMYLKDMIRFTKGFIGAQYQNFGEMRTMGVEAEIKADLLPSLYGYVNATYQDLRDIRKYEENSSIPNPTYGKRMPNIPYMLANAGLEFHKENLFGGKGHNTRIFADYSLVEEYLYDFEVAMKQRRIPLSSTFDIGFEHSLQNGRYIISAKVKNLADAKVLSEFNRPLPGRSFGIKVRYVFK